MRAIMLGIPLRDITGGYRAYRASALWKIGLEDIESVGYCFQIDLVRRAVQAGLTVAEVPITFVERTHGASKMSKAIVREALWRVTRWGIGRRLRRPRIAPSQGLQARTGTKKGASHVRSGQRGRLRPDASSTPRARE